MMQLRDVAATVPDVTESTVTVLVVELVPEMVIDRFVSVVGASNVISTMMEGFRRAYNRPPHQWGFWHRRRISFMLVPMSLLPLALTRGR